MKKALPPITLVLIGAALLITAVVFWIDSSISTEPQSFGKALLDWITLIAGLGASIKGWMDLFKKEKPTPPTTKIDVKGGSPQISTGDHARNIQAETYIENQTLQQAPQPKTPKSLKQLPTPPLDFIGREKELAQLHQNIQKGIVISGVQGMGGIGKTALGLKLAEQIAMDYPDGQIYLDLRGAHEQMPLTPEQVMAHVLRSFHPETVLPLDIGELSAMYRSVLNGKKVMLFYDNARDEKQLDSLLPPKSCTLFVTSRQYFTLPGLAAVDLETLTSEDAIALVQEISSKVNDKDAETIAKLCGYLPLAIRAAASILSRRPDWSAAKVVKQLGKNVARLGLIENSLSLSYDALDWALQKRLRQLGIFAAPFDKESILISWIGALRYDLDSGTWQAFGLPVLMQPDSYREMHSEEYSVQKAEENLGILIKAGMIRYDFNSNKYYFHDLIKLFIEQKFFLDGKSGEILERYAVYVLGWLNSLLTEIDPSSNGAGTFIINSAYHMVSFTADKLMSMRVIETINVCISLFRQDVAEVGSKYYSINNDSVPLAWTRYITFQKDIQSDLSSLSTSITQLKFAASGIGIASSKITNLLSLISRLESNCYAQIRYLTKKYSQKHNDETSSIDTP